MTDILFLCKLNKNFMKRTGSNKRSGLSNSVKLTAQQLKNHGYNPVVVDVENDTDIEYLIGKYQPKKAIIEALWVSDKVLVRLTSKFPKVKFYVHLHSQIPFLSIESRAMEQTRTYTKCNVGVIANADESYNAFRCFLSEDMVFNLQNLYGKPFNPPKEIDVNKDTIDIACFGAIRPMKNQLIQAMAAYDFCKRMDKKLRFHINSSRVESGGQPVLQNLINFFIDLPNAELVPRGWIEPEVLIDEIRETIDIGMQVSMTETFNITCCDYTAAGIPLVASDAVSWVGDHSKVDMHRSDSITFGLLNAFSDSEYQVKENQERLNQHCEKALKQWTDFVEG
jgi:hypothetical protein